MSASENVELYRRVIEEGFSKGDLTVIDEVLSPDFVEYEIVPGQAPGRQGVKDIVTMMRTAFPDLHLTLQDAITSGDQLCGRLTFSGTNTGPFMGQTADGPGGHRGARSTSCASGTAASPSTGARWTCSGSSGSSARSTCKRQPDGRIR